MASLPSIPESIQTFVRRWPEQIIAESSQAPIFIFSAGWRSGSTLLQRLVLSDNTVFIWGEPYAHCNLVRSLANSLRCFSATEPNDTFFLNNHLASTKEAEQISEKWVANLYPMPDDLRKAHRVFFKTLYEEPAQAVGYPRWGFKEVRLSGEYAHYLKFLFPDAKFLFLYRNPYDAYRSYKSFRAWYDVWPEKPIGTPFRYGMLWKRLLSSFLDTCQDVDGFLVRYEDLVSGKLNSAAIANYLGTNSQVSVLKKHVSGERKAEVTSLSALERLLLKAAVHPLDKK